jgi:hypothetical protein
MLAEAVNGAAAAVMIRFTLPACAAVQFAILVAVVVPV